MQKEDHDTPPFFLIWQKKSVQSRHDLLCVFRDMDTVFRPDSADGRPGSPVDDTDPDDKGRTVRSGQHRIDLLPSSTGA